MSNNNIKKNNKNIKNKIKEDTESKTYKYKTYVEPRFEEIKAWVRDGLIEEDIAKRLGIAYSTFREYKKKHSALSALLIRTKEIFDNQVVDALHKNTLGGIIELTVPMKIKKTFFNSLGKKEREEEEIVYVKTQEYIKPDTMAQIYWLNNRQKEKWKSHPIEETREKESESKLNELITSLDKHVKDATKGQCESE